MRALLVKKLSIQYLTLPAVAGRMTELTSNVRRPTSSNNPALEYFPYGCVLLIPSRLRTCLRTSVLILVHGLTPGRPRVATATDDPARLDQEREHDAAAHPGLRLGVATAQLQVVCAGAVRPGRQGSPTVYAQQWRLWPVKSDPNGPGAFAGYH
jgi:hypothetical protein